MSTPKRKREHESNTKVTFVLDDQDSKDGVEGPFIATFPAPAPVQNITFDVYKQGKQPNGAPPPPRKAKQRIIAGETERVEFEGRNFGPEAIKGCYCRYVIGVYDPETNQVVLKEAPALEMHRTVKRLKVAAIIQGDRDQFKQARDALGETFGSKKAKNKIRSEERNRVDVTGMENVEQFINEAIQENAAEMPTKEEVKLAMNEDRPIPPYDLSATTPDAIYKKDDICPSEELKAVPIKAILEASSKEERISCLPFTRSNFINDRIDAAAASKKDRSRLRDLIYLAILLRFRTMREKELNDEMTSPYMKNLPQVILNGLFERFTEVPSASTKPIHKITPKLKDKITNYALALALSLENYTLDPGPLASDLELGPMKIVEHLRALGCKVEALSRSEAEAAGMSAMEARAKKLRKAILVAPLVFPEPRKLGKHSFKGMLNTITYIDKFSIKWDT